MAKPLVRFGKYQHLTFEELVKIDPDYYIALRKSEDFKQYSASEVRNYNKFHKKHLASKKELTKLKKVSDIPRDMFNEAIQLMYRWVGKDEFEKTMIEKYPKSKLRVKECYSSALAFYKRQTELDKINLISLHIARYEDMYNELEFKDLTNLKPDKRFGAEIARYTQMANILQSKEKIVGVHNKTFKIRLNNYFQKKKIFNEPELNFENLTLEEKLELFQLFDKCKTEDQEIFKISKPNVDQVIEDVSFEEVDLLENTLKGADIVDDSLLQVKPALSFEDIKNLLKNK